jgi:malonyl-CoA O-methyltransferase
VPDPVVKEFSLYVDTYETHAVVQKIAAETLMQLLKQEYQPENFSTPGQSGTGAAKIIARPLSILEIGCGTGILTRPLLELFPESYFLCVDGSKAMLQKLKKSIRGEVAHTSTRLKEIDCNRLSEFLFHPNFSADLVVSSFALQWMYDLPFALRSISAVLIPGGLLAIAIPGSESFPEWRQACDLAEVPFTANPLPGHQELHNTFSQLKFAGALHESVVTQRFRSSRDFFKSLKMAGASKQLLLPGEPERKLSARDFNRLVKAWDSLYSPGKVELSYQIILAVLEKH